MKIISGWSFCVVTNKTPDDLWGVVNNIKNNINDSPYEIIIIGDGECNYNDASIKYLSYRPLNKLLLLDWKSFFLEFKIKFKIPIAAKKNLAIINAKYENLCILHDYVMLDSGWLKGFERFGYDWDICCNKIIDQCGRRFLDWVVWDHPEISGPGYIDYDKKSPYQYVSGTYFCVKKSFIINNMLQEKLCWGEGEDVEWSKRVRGIAKLKFNPLSRVILNKDKGSWSHEGDWKKNSEKLKLIIK